MTTRYTVEYNNNILRYIKIFVRDNLAITLFSSYDLANILETSEDNILKNKIYNYSIMSFGSEDNVKFVHHMIRYPTVGEPINKTLFDNFYRFIKKNIFTVVAGVDTELFEETIMDLRETVELLKDHRKSLEKLLRLKDMKIQIMQGSFSFGKNTRN